MPRKKEGKKRGLSSSTSEQPTSEYTVVNYGHHYDEPTHHALSSKVHNLLADLPLHENKPPHLSPPTRPTHVRKPDAEHVLPLKKPSKRSALRTHNFIGGFDSAEPHSRPVHKPREPTPPSFSSLAPAFSLDLAEKNQAQSFPSHENVAGSIQALKEDPLRKVYELDGWIEQRLSEGWSEQRIVDELCRVGWEHHDVQKSHERVHRKLQRQVGIHPQPELKQDMMQLVSKFKRAFKKEEELSQKLLEEIHEEQIREEEQQEKEHEHEKEQELQEKEDYRKLQEQQTSASEKGNAQSQQQETDEQFDQPDSYYLSGGRSTPSAKSAPVQPRMPSSSRPIEGRSASTHAAPSLDTSRLKAEIERLKAHHTAHTESRKITNERFLKIAEEMGSMRETMFNLERDMKDVMVRVAKAVDVVEAIKPQQFYTDLRRQDARMESQQAKLESNRSLMDKLVEELKEMRRKMSMFRGIEQNLKLNEEVSKDLRSLQRIKTTIERHADKVENMFAEMKKKFARFEEFEGIGKEMKATSTHTLKELESIKAKELTYASKDELKGTADQQEQFVEATAHQIDGLRSEIADLHSSLGNVDLGNLHVLQNHLEELDRKAHGILKESAGKEQLYHKLSQLVERKTIAVAHRISALEQSFGDLTQRIDKNESGVSTLTEHKDDALTIVIEELNTLKKEMAELYSFYQQTKHSRPVYSSSVTPRLITKNMDDQKLKQYFSNQQ